MTTEHLNNLADALENIAHMEYPSDHHDRKNLAEAARILRSAAAVDVKALITIVQDFGSARWAEGFDEKNKPHGESALHKKVALKKLAELESALRLALAAREGFVMVPVEPTPDMLEAGAGTKYEKRARNVWRDKIAAAAPKGTT